MNDMHRKPGRPPKQRPQDESVVDEAVVENFTQEETVLIEQAQDADAPIAESFVSDESPIEEKIHQLVDAMALPPVVGWENDMYMAPKDGRRIMVSSTAKDQGSLVYWRISKFVDKKNLRYVPKGRWTDFLTKNDITFVPKYWKSYNPEEYWPLTV